MYGVPKALMVRRHYSYRGGLLDTLLYDCVFRKNLGRLELRSLGIEATLLTST